MLSAEALWEGWTKRIESPKALSPSEYDYVIRRQSKMRLRNGTQTHSARCSMLATVCSRDHNGGYLSARVGRGSEVRVPVEETVARDSARLLP